MRRKLTQTQIDQMKVLYARRSPPLSAAQIGKLFRVSNTTVLRAVEGKGLPAPEGPPEPLRSHSYKPRETS